MLLPDIDPVAFSIGPIAIRWYALAYLSGLFIGWFYARKLSSNNKFWGDITPPSSQQLDDLLIYATLGVILGGRLGFVLFYKPFYYFSQPLEIFQTWKGGMSFHGGLFGAWLAVFIFAKRSNLSPFAMTDLAASVAPIGLFLGRMANFIKGELWGRVTDAPWGFIFPEAGPYLRHPSQLYEAALEGVFLFIILTLSIRKWGFSRPGLISGIFGVGYACSRFFVEFFREPDAYLGFLAGGWLTMGMSLSIPMFFAGIFLIWQSLRSRNSPVR